MKEIAPSEFKKMTFQMLIAFAELCEREGLRYTLDYGTLLGCVRHNGFIPWDDDIDVSMPRSDYEKFFDLLEKSPELLGKYYRLSSYRNMYTTQKPCHNIIDIRTITKSPSRISKYYYPVWIDVFPMDYLPENREEAENTIKTCNKLLHLCQVSYNPGSGSFRPLKRLIYSFQLPFLNKRLKRIDSIGMSITSSKSLLTNYMSPYGIKDVSDINYYDEYIYEKFEGSEFRIPKSYDIRLKSVYGDYMKLPPEDKRIPHVTHAFWISEYSD